MSINWVMLDDAHTIVPLSRERILHTSPPRISLAIEPPNPYPGKSPFSLHCNSGKAFLTNQRLVFLPAEPNENFKSFSAPIMNLQDTHVSAPIFGANNWSGILLPVNGGGIPPHHTYLKIKMTFKEGGAFDFDNTYQRIKENVSQASELAQESGRPVDLSTVDLDQLPAYEEVAGSSPILAAPPAPISTSDIQQPTPISPRGPVGPSRIGGSIHPWSNPQPTRRPNNAQAPPPNEPPPGYDEVQRSSVAESLEASIRRSSR